VSIASCGCFFDATFFAVGNLQGVGQRWFTPCFFYGVVRNAFGASVPQPKGWGTRMARVPEAVRADFLPSLRDFMISLTRTRHLRAGLLPVVPAGLISG
jgi:hypothetical protein